MGNVGRHGGGAHDRRKGEREPIATDRGTSRLSSHEVSIEETSERWGSAVTCWSRPSTMSLCWARILYSFSATLEDVEEFLDEAKPREHPSVGQGQCPRIQARCFAFPFSSKALSRTASARKRASGLNRQPGYTGTDDHLLIPPAPQPEPTQPRTTSAHVLVEPRCVCGLHPLSQRCDLSIL